MLSKLEEIFNLENLDGFNFKYEDNSLTKQIDLKTFLNKIKNSLYYDYLLESIRNINTSVLYNSNTHGIDHNIRTCIFAYFIAINLNLSLDDINLVIEASKYHDIGRINDEDDGYHGFRSATKLDGLVNLSNEDMNIIKAMITSHSINDKLFSRVFEHFKISDEERCLKLTKILKDADGLDRVRLGSEWLDPNYLRFNVSKELVIVCNEFFHYYEGIKKGN